MNYSNMKKIFLITLLILGGTLLFGCINTPTDDSTLTKEFVLEKLNLVEQEIDLQIEQTKIDLESIQEGSDKEYKKLVLTSMEESNNSFIEDLQFFKTKISENDENEYAKNNSIILTLNATFLSNAIAVLDLTDKLDLLKDENNTLEEITQTRTEELSKLINENIKLKQIDCPSVNPATLNPKIFDKQEYAFSKDFENESCSEFINLLEEYINFKQTKLDNAFNSENIIQIIIVGENINALKQTYGE
jgi:hypothetical protein